jgi:two-component system NtrC family response regulator
MQEGRFREDLYYRLAVVVLNLPPLRDRDGDARMLAQEFLRRFGTEFHKESLTFDSDALKAIARHSWPGNVRELENRTKRAVIMAETKRVTARDLELASPLAALPGSALKDAREAAEREIVSHILRKHGGKITAAAVELGISRPTLYELMEKLGITRSSDQ